MARGPTGAIGDAGLAIFERRHHLFADGFWEAAPAGDFAHRTSTTQAPACRSVNGADLDTRAFDGFDHGPLLVEGLRHHKMQFESCSPEAIIGRKYSHFA